MRKIENDCCGCATETYPCIGNSCSLRHVEHFYCDKCGNETKLYSFLGQELCEECILNELEPIEGSY